MPIAAQLTPNTYYHETIVTTPANTGSLATTVDLGLAVLKQIVVLWPPGLNAVTGVAFTLDGVTIVPWNQPGQFVFDSANRRYFDVGMLLNHPIIIRTHNAGTSAHQNFITFVTTDPVLQGDNVPESTLPILTS